MDALVAALANKSTKSAIGEDTRVVLVPASSTAPKSKITIIDITWYFKQWEGHGIVSSTVCVVRPIQDDMQAMRAVRVAAPAWFKYWPVSFRAKYILSARRHAGGQKSSSVLMSAKHVYKLLHSATYLVRTPSHLATFASGAAGTEMTGAIEKTCYAFTRHSSVKARDVWITSHHAAKLFNMAHLLPCIFHSDDVVVELIRDLARARDAMVSGQPLYVAVFIACHCILTPRVLSSVKRQAVFQFTHDDANQFASLLNLEPCFRNAVTQAMVGDAFSAHIDVARGLLPSMMVDAVPRYVSVDEFAVPQIRWSGKSFVGSFTEIIGRLHELLCDYSSSGCSAVLFVPPFIDIDMLCMFLPSHDIVATKNPCVFAVKVSNATVKSTPILIFPELMLVNDYNCHLRTLHAKVGFKASVFTCGSAAPFASVFDYCVTDEHSPMYSSGDTVWCTQIHPQVAKNCESSSRDCMHFTLDPVIVLSETQQMRAMRLAEHREFKPGTLLCINNDTVVVEEHNARERTVRYCKRYSGTGRATAADYALLPPIASCYNRVPFLPAMDLVVIVANLKQKQWPIVTFLAQFVYGTIYVQAK